MEGWRDPDKEENKEKMNSGMEKRQVGIGQEGSMQAERR